MSKAQESSVRNLENLYSVVIGLGLTLGIVTLVDPSKTPIPIKPNLLPFFISYLVTLIPFYHGALRHLDARYIEGHGQDPGSGALLGDFFVLFLESCIFFALALLLPSPTYYVCGFVLLLAVDAAWGFVARVAFVDAKPESHWALLNVIVAAALIVILAVMHGLPPRIPDQTDPALPFIVLAISVVRTALDYKLTWDFYFPT